MIGGCCGTTPAHIAAMRTAIGSATPSASVDRLKPILITPADFHWGEQHEAEAPHELGTQARSWRVCCERGAGPAQGTEPHQNIEGAALLRDVGVDCINIGDSPMARVRMSCIALALLIQSRVGLETIIHFTTRDRNLMALQSELLGAHALGIRHILALTGDPPADGAVSQRHGRMGRRLDRAGQSAKAAERGRGLGRQLDRSTIAHSRSRARSTRLPRTLSWSWIASIRRSKPGPILRCPSRCTTWSSSRAFLDRVGKIPIPFILGVMPLQSHKHTEFLHNELPGVTIPDVVRRAHASGR